jgi:hypothetical protein
MSRVGTKKSLGAEAIRSKNLERVQRRVYDGDKKCSRVVPSKNIVKHFAVMRRERRFRPAEIRHLVDERTLADDRADEIERERPIARVRTRQPPVPARAGAQQTVIASEEAATDGRETRTITARNLAMDHPSVSAARRAFTSCLSRSIPGGEKAGLSRRLLTIACLRLFLRMRSKPDELYIVPLGEEEGVSTPSPGAQLDIRRKSLQ